MKISSWGLQPVIDTKISLPTTVSGIRASLENSFSGAVRGLGRSYGDAALADALLDTRALNHILGFDADEGLLECQAGVSLDQMLRTIVPKGWFLPVTPGTRFITLGGAIASDVHGKNHHCAGCFSDHITFLELMTGDGKTVTCSHSENAELFHATCGGMGLTGVITRAQLKLIPITNSFIEQRAINTVDLEDTLTLLNEHDEYPYSVAWLDTVNHKRNRMGAGRLYLGKHSDDPTLGRLPGKQSQISVPAGSPRVIYPITVSLFNHLYRARQRSRQQDSLVHYQPFFYPLDGIQDWNRLYGRQGLYQYQFVLPEEAGSGPLVQLIKTIIKSGLSSPLVVLKKFGAANGNLLSFPVTGYTFAVDFVQCDASRQLIQKLDHLLLPHGGRTYLTKDATMTPDCFRQSYPNWSQFMEVRARYEAAPFQSMLASRLALLL